jgi:hypothetical protein
MSVPRSVIDIVRSASVASATVRAAREQEAAIDKLAREVAKSKKRTRKGEQKHPVVKVFGEELAAVVEQVVEQTDTAASNRKIRTHSGREVPLSALREGVLKYAEAVFGADKPLHIVCAHCGVVFLVPAGTKAQNVPKTCARGCRCVCGRRIGRIGARRAVNEGRRSKCRGCASHENMAKVTTEQRHANIAVCNAALTPDQRRAYAKNAGAAAAAKQTPEQRSERARKAVATRGAKSVQASAMKGRASIAKMTPDQKRARAIKGNSAQTTEQRRARQVKGWATRRAKSALKSEAA